MESMSISINLTVAQWNVVLNALGGRPFAEVNDLINAIKTQAEAQIVPAPVVEEPAQAE